MAMYKLTVFMKTGRKFVNKEAVGQKFVDAIYDCIADDKDMVIQIQTGKTAAVMVPLKNVDFVQIDLST